MQPFLVAKQDEIAELCRRYHVKRLSVFGSSARADFDPSRSDIDLIVEFQSEGIPNRFETYFAFEDALEQFFHREVDLIEAGSVRNPYIQEAIDRDQQILYAA